jgi:hypothetical protein
MGVADNSQRSGAIYRIHGVHMLDQLLFIILETADCIDPEITKTKLLSDNISIMEGIRKLDIVIR